MPLSNLIGTYGDVQRLLATALKNPGMAYVADSPGQAVHTRARCNKYRALLSRENEAVGLAGTPFDNLVLTLDGPRIIFSQRTASLPGTILNAAGEPIELVAEDESIVLDLDTDI
jgi:hypothetical protein